MSSTCNSSGAHHCFVLLHHGFSCYIDVTVLAITAFNFVVAVITTTSFLFVLLELFTLAVLQILPLRKLSKNLH